LCLKLKKVNGEIFNLIGTKVAKLERLNETRE